MLPRRDPRAQPVWHEDSLPVPASSLTSHVTRALGAFLVSCLVHPRADLAVK